MKTPFVLVLTLCFCTSVYSQKQNLIPYRKGALWGYADPAGKIVMEPVYHRTYFFSNDDLARVQVNGLFGYIDREGNNKIAPQFIHASDFFMGVARVSLNNKEFCINAEGEEDECNDDCSEEEIPEELEQEAFTIEQHGQHYQLIINHKADTVDQLFDHIEIISRYLFPQTYHFAIVTKNGLKGAYSEQGIRVAPLQYTQLDVLDMSLYKAVQQGKWGVLEVNGSTVLPFVYDSIGKVSEIFFIDDSTRHNDHYIVRKHNHYGIVNGKDQWILEPIYDQIIIPEPCSCPLEYIVQVDGLYGIASPSGAVIIPPLYKAVEPFYSSLVTRVITRSGKEGYINKAGLEYFAD